MPVIATPAVAAPSECCDPFPQAPTTPTPVPCADQFILTPATAVDRGKPVLARMKSVTIKGKKEARIRWTMVNDAGLPVDLTDCLCLGNSSSSSLSEGDSISEVSESVGSEAACPYRLAFCMRESLDLGRRSCQSSVCLFSVAVIDAANGVVEVVIPPSETKRAGIFFGEFALLGSDAGEDYVVFSNVFYLRIQITGWSNKRNLGPPSIAEIRLQLRDSSPTESYLLDRLKFDDAEIDACTIRAIQQWNEEPPDLGQWTTQDFPYRYNWTEAIIGNLFAIAAEQFRANNLKYQTAGGLSLNDQDKEPNYDRAAQIRQQAWMSFIKRKKGELNLAGAWGTLGSPYGRM